MNKLKHKIDEYKEISQDVWVLFKKYFPEDAQTDDFTLDVHELRNKYRENAKWKNNVRAYCFFEALLKVYFDELNELKGLHDGKDS